MSRLSDERASDAREPYTGYVDQRLASAIGAMTGKASEAYEDSTSYLYMLKDDIRSEFRQVYESIIDSTLASMY